MTRPHPRSARGRRGGALPHARTAPATGCPPARTSESRDPRALPRRSPRRQAHATGDEHPAVLEPRGGVQVSRVVSVPAACHVAPAPCPSPSVTTTGRVPSGGRGRGRRRLGSALGEGPIDDVGTTATAGGNGRGFVGEGAAGQQGPAGRAAPRAIVAASSVSPRRRRTPRPIEHRHRRDRLHGGAQRGRRQVLDPGVAEVARRRRSRSRSLSFIASIPRGARPSMVSCSLRRA